MSRTTIVGYDGSPAAKAALTLASARVGPEGHVRAIHVLTLPSGFIEAPYYERALDPARERAHVVLEELEREAPPGVTAEVVTDRAPASALAAAAAHSQADDIVVGSRGLSPMRAAVMGSTSHALLHEATLPVAVIPQAALDRAPPEPGSPIVVGFDGSQHARDALAYARERAAQSGGRVVAVTAYEPPSDWLGSPYYGRALRDHEDQARELLEGLEREGSGDLEVDLLQGPPAEALARAADARDAAEIVIGSRGLGRFRGAVGSVSHALIHEARCPVVVVPHRACADSPQATR